MLVKRVPSPIRTGKSLVSMRTVPAGIGLIVAARTPATRSSFRPAATALARSTLTWTTGWLAARLVATSLLPGTPSMALTIASLAVWRSAVVAALRVMSTVDEVPKPPCWEPTVIFPASPSLASSLRTVSWSLPWLAFSSVTTVNVELDAPEESRAEKPVWALPVVTWTSLIPSMPRRVSSTRIGRGAGLVKAGPGRQGLLDGHAVLAGAAQEVGGEQRGHRHGAAEHQGRGDEGEDRVPLRAGQDGQVAALQAACAARPRAPWRQCQRQTPAEPVTAGGAQEPVRQHRHDGQRDQQRGEQGDGHGQGERPEQLAGQVADEGDGQEDGHGGQGGRRDGAGDFADGGQDGGDLVLAVAQVPLDVLDDHDRVVHHAADRDGERAEGEDVERVAGGREPDERDQQGQRDGHGRHQGGRARTSGTPGSPATAKPSPSRPSVVRSLMDFSMNGAWSKTGVNLALEPSSASSWRDGVLDRVGDRDGVALGLLGHGQGEGFLAVGPRD